MDTSAEFSACRTFRYTLTRQWGEGRPLNVIGLNPSTADETKDDPTIRRCIGFARQWGCSGLVMTNLFAYRATDPKVMKAAPDPVGPENDRYIVESATRSQLVLAAWGVHGEHRWRAAHVRLLLKAIGIPVHCFGRTKAGHPKHPLYLPNGIEPEVYWGEPLKMRPA